MGKNTIEKLSQAEQNSQLHESIRNAHNPKITYKNNAYMNHKPTPNLVNRNVAARPTRTLLIFGFNLNDSKNLYHSKRPKYPSMRERPKTKPRGQQTIWQGPTNLPQKTGSQQTKLNRPNQTEPGHKTKHHGLKIMLYISCGDKTGDDNH